MAYDLPASIQVVHCVVCDDVRTEINSKETIVGVYSAGMIAPVLPWQALVCIWMTVIWSGDGNLNLEVRILNPRQDQVGLVSGTAQAMWIGMESALTFRGLALQIGMEGVYTIQWRPAGGNWDTIRQFPIYLYRQG